MNIKLEMGNTTHKWELWNGYKNWPNDVVSPCFQ